MTTVRVLIADSDPALRAAVAGLLVGDATIQLLEGVADFVAACGAVERLHPDVLALDSRLLSVYGATLSETEAALRPTRLLLLTADEDELLRLRRYGLAVVLKERAHDLLAALRATGVTRRCSTA